MEDLNQNLYFKNGKLRKQPKKIVIKEEFCKYDVTKNTYGGGKANRIKISKDKKDHEAKYDPPLPVSVIKEDKPNISMIEKPYESTCEIYNMDCLEKMKDIPDNSVDLIFCDLPYGQTSCKWDSLIDLEQFWIQVMRIKKLNTPIFMTTTTKFGVSLIQSAPKKCYFRYDLIWVKSAPAGFLSAKKMPMRKHEMVYVFYEKLPFYDLSSHQHKFIKEGKKTDEDKGNEPPSPVSVVKEEKHLYDKGYDTSYKQEDNSDNQYRKAGRKGNESAYEPPLPTTMLEIKSTRGKHSTEKPVALMEWIFKYYSKEGDVILDPTMGSGSTGVACKNMNRNFIGIEMDKDIFKVAEDRLFKD
tara:strand:- start:650 stop:1714 length:1065 start_codon:yes stop_codon:yes gene_type:complete